MRGKRRVVELTTEEVRAQIASTEEQITKLTDELKSLRLQKKNLMKDLAVAEKKEAAAKEEADMKELVRMIQQKGLSVEQVKDILDKQ